jgi:hypothetical protein
MNFEIISGFRNIEIIAVRHSIRELSRLRKRFGAGRWRKIKGIAIIRFANGEICNAELHWYEARGIGRKEFKIKRIID